VAMHAPFAARSVDGDWPVDAFDREELRVLRARQPFLQRDRSHDGIHPVLDFAELLAWCAAQAKVRGAPLRLYPEIKHPTAFAAAGVDPVPRFIDMARATDPEAVALW